MNLPRITFSDIGQMLRKLPDMLARAWLEIEGADLQNLKRTGDIDFSHGITLRGAVRVATVDGVDINPGSDADADLLTVGVTGAPRLWWDESGDQFTSTHGLTAVDGTFTGVILAADGSAVSPSIAFASNPAYGLSLSGGNTLVFSLNSGVGMSLSAGQLALPGVNGFDLQPGSDVDTDLLTVTVTGTPRLWWDESDDRFTFTHGLDVDAGGLTLDQGANDDQIAAFKSSDVNHALVSVAETDTYGAFTKANALSGGLTITAVAEQTAPVGNPGMLTLEMYGSAADTTKSASGRALVEVYAAAHDGADALANIAADGNVFGVRARVGGADVMRWMVDEDGDTWQAGGATLTTLEVGSATGINATTSMLVSSQGNECINVNTASAAAALGFFGATPVNQQTGVAVTAAGIHAALVNLGLITA